MAWISSTMNKIKKDTEDQKKEGGSPSFESWDSFLRKKADTGLSGLSTTGRYAGLERKPLPVVNSPRSFTENELRVMGTATLGGNNLGATHAHRMQTDDKNDMGNKELNKVYGENLKKAEGWNLAGVDTEKIREGIQQITRNFWDFLQTSVNLNRNNLGNTDFLGLAEKRMDAEMDTLHAKLETEGLDAAGIRELMDKAGFQDRFQVQNANRQRVIDQAGRETGTGDAWRRAFKDAQADERTIAPRMGQAGGETAQEGVKGVGAQEDWRREDSPEMDAARALLDENRPVGETLQNLARLYESSFAQMNDNPAMEKLYDTLSDETAARLDELMDAVRYGEQIDPMSATELLEDMRNELGVQDRLESAAAPVISQEPEGWDWQLELLERREAAANAEAAAAAHPMPEKRMTWEEADRYMEGQSPVYSVVRDNPGKAEEIAGLFENAAALVRKARQNGMDGLTDAEKDVYYALMNGASALGTYNPGADDSETAAQLNQLGQEYARQVREMGGLFTGYSPTEYQSQLWDAYIHTPEGAQYYLEQSKGTDQYNAAQNNYYWVEQDQLVKKAMADPEFETLSQARPDEYTDAEYRIVNAPGLGAYAAGLGHTENDDALRWQAATPEERAIYNYYRAIGDTEAAKRYKEGVTYELDKRLTEGTNENIGKSLDDAGALGYIGANIYSVLADVGSGLLGQADLWTQYIRNKLAGEEGYRPVNPYGAAQAPYHQSQKIGEKTEEAVTEALKDSDINPELVNMVISGTKSIAVSRLQAALGMGLFGKGKLGQALSALSSASRSGQEAAQQALQQGGTDDQMALRMAAGTANEAGWELLEFRKLNRFLSDAGAGKADLAKYAGQVLYDIAINGLQEGFTSGGEILLDNAIMGDKSAESKLRDYLSDYGMFPEEIDMLIDQQRKERIGKAAASGAIMGGIGATIDIGAGIHAQGKYNQATGSLMNVNTKQNLAELAKNSSDKVVQKAGAKFDPLRSSDKQAGQLLQQVMKGLPQQMRSSLQGMVAENVARDAAERLSAMDGDTLLALAKARDGQSLTDREQRLVQRYVQDQQAAEVIGKMVAGQELTPEEARALAASERGMALVRNMMAEDYAETQRQDQQAQEAREETQDEDWDELPTAEGDRRAEAEARAREQTEQAEARRQRIAQIEQDLANERAAQARMEEETQEAVNGQNTQAEERAARIAQLEQDLANERAAQARMEEEAQEAVNGQNTQAEERAARIAQLEQDLANEQAAQARMEEEAQAAVNGQNAQAGERAARIAQLEQNLANERADQARMEEEARAAVKVKGAEGESTEHQATFRQREDGLVAVLEDGAEVDAGDLDMNDADAAVVDAAESLEDEAAANGMIADLSGTEDAEKARSMAGAWLEAYRQGRDGKKFDYQALLREGLAEETARRAWENGQRAYQEAQDKQTQDVRDAAKQDGFRALADAKERDTGLFYDDVDKPVTKAQKTQLQLVDLYARQNGWRVIVHKSMGNKNASYKKGTNIINLSLDAENGYLTRVVSHEGYHYIMDHDAKAGRQIMGFVLDTLKNKGMDLDARRQEVMDTYRDEADQELTPEEADEEIAGDGLLDVIGTEDNLKALAKAQNQGEEKNTGLIQRIRDWLARTAQRLKNLMNRFAENSQEAALLKDDADYIAQVRNMYETALKNLSQNKQQAQAGLYQGVKSDPAVQTYAQDMASAATQEDAQAALNGLLWDAYTRTQTSWITAHPDLYEQGFQIFSDVLRKFGIGEANSLYVALAAREMDTPQGEAENQLLSYAARQLAKQEQENNDTRFDIKKKIDKSNETLEKNKRNVANMPSVRSLKGDEVLLSKGEINQQVRNIYVETGKTASSPELGDVDLIPGIASSRGHGLGQEKAAAYVAVKDVIEKGKLVAYTDNYKQRGYDRAVVAAPIELGGEPYYMGVMLNRYNDHQRFYLHEIWLQNGNTKNKQSAHHTMGLDDQSSLKHGSDSAYMNSILEEIRKYKGIEENNSDSLSERYSVRRDTEADARQTAAGVRADAELYAQVMSDEDIRAAVEALGKVLDSVRHISGTMAVAGKWQERLDEFASQVITETDSKISKQKLKNEMARLFQLLDDGKTGTPEALMFARDIAREVLEKAPGTLMEQDETTRDILNTLKNRPFFLTQDQRSEIRGTYGDVQTYRRKNFGKLRIRAEGNSMASLADVWAEDLAPRLPSVFSEDASPNDMPGILDAWLENAGKKRYTGEFGANIQQYSTSLGLEMLGQYLDAPWTNERTDRLKEAFNRNAAAIKDYYQKRYEERINKSRERKEQTDRKRQLRDRIARDVKDINKLNVAPSDSRHVPEEMRRAALEAVRPFLRNTSVFSQAALDRLGRMYSALQEQESQAGGFDADILASIQAMAEKMEGKRLSDLTEQELNDISEVVGNLHKMILRGNEAFVNGRKTTIDALSGQYKEDMRAMQARDGKFWAGMRQFSYKMETPVYFADRVGGVTKAMIGDLFKGSYDWAFVQRDSKGFMQEQIDKYHVNDWYHDKNHLRFQTRAGDMIELDRAHALSLYALWNRERTNVLQDACHLRVGGFLYENGASYEGVDTKKPHTITESDMQMVRGYLTEEQMAFADEMVRYLSEDMSALGNEVSMALYGYEKFKEKYYFPYASGGDYLNVNLTDNGERVTQPKNKGMTKALRRNAATPVTLGDFSEVWGNHVNDMGIYYGFAQAMDTMNRVLNDKTSADVRTDPNTGEILSVAVAESNWALMRKAIGDEGVNYFKTLARDIAGGVRADERGPMAKGLSLFKKASVAANLSVTLQQPTAIARAMMMVNPKYLLMANPANIGKSIRQMEQYSGVAVIKDMGRFDTGTGKGAVAWLTDGITPESKGRQVLDVIDNVSGKGAEMADKWTWGLLWDAISKETQHTRTDLAAGTEEFYQAVAERFNDVVNHTQVYDSTLSRSEWMRSQTVADKMVTSFMAEPTLSFNMLMDTVTRFNQDGMGAKKVARAAATFAANAFLTALAKSIMQATRKKKEEGKTWLEKYIAAVTANFVDDVSPFGIAGMIPWVRDAISIFEGYDVERSDMDALVQLKNGYKALAKFIQGGDITLEDTLEKTLSPIANLFGIPLKNVWRDWEGIVNQFTGGSRPIAETSGRDIKYSVLDELKLGPISLWDSGNAAYYERMEQALIRGDQAKYDELYGYLTETKQVKETTVATGIKKEILDSAVRGLVSEEKAMEVLTQVLGMDEKKAFQALDKALQEAEAKAEEDEEFSYKVYGSLLEEAKKGGDIAGETKRLMEHGYTEKDVLSEVKSGIKEWFVNGEIDRTTAEKRLKQYIPTLSDNGVFIEMEKWEGCKKGNKDAKGYEAYIAAIDTGEKLRDETKRYLDHGVAEKTLAGKITEHFKPLYIAAYERGDKTAMAEIQARALTAYEMLGKDRNTKMKDIQEWIKQYEKSK